MTDAVSIDTGCRYCNHRYKSIFADMNELEVNLISTVKKCVEFKKGEVVFKENTLPRGLYCIKSGKLKISRLGIDGKEQIIHFAQNGDVMGFRAILSDNRYNCSATALENSNLCFIPKNTFVDMVKSSQKLSLRVISLLSNMLKESEIKITVLGQNTVKEKLLHSLFLLINKYGFEADGRTINVNVSRQELADIAGTTRETATRVLFELEEEGILTLIGKTILILDYSQLLKMSNIN